jgi:hypothetical protein
MSANEPSESKPSVPVPITAQAYSVDEFCDAHRISRGYFYVLLREGKAPAILKLGRRTLVTAEAAADWRRRFTQPAAA